MQAVQYKCPTCGGDIFYNPDKGAFICEYCNNAFSFEQVVNANKRNEKIDLSDVEKQERQNEFEENAALYLCPSCGSEIIAEKNAVTLECYYCHSPVTLVGRLSGEYKPDYIIPFTVSKERAEQIFQDFCRDKKLLPDDFKNGKVLQKITGVYVPFWLGNYSIDTRVIAECKKYIPVNRNTDRVREYSVDDSALVYYQNVPADGARLIDDELLDALQPYNYHDLHSFSMSYLSGFMAEKYDVGAEEALARHEDVVKAECVNFMHKHLKKDYDSVAINQAMTERQSLGYKYAFLPVWFLTYKYRDKIYQYGINGQTGKVSGSIPIDNKKLNLRALLFSLFGAAFGAMFGFFIVAFLS